MAQILSRSAASETFSLKNLIGFFFGRIMKCVPCSYYCRLLCSHFGAFVFSALFLGRLGRYLSQSGFRPRQRGPDEKTDSRRFLYDNIICLAGCPMFGVFSLFHAEVAKLTTI
jgi:hypothetical protein